MNQNVIEFLQVTEKEIFSLYWNQHSTGLKYVLLTVVWWFSLHISESEGQIEYSNDESR